MTYTQIVLGSNLSQFATAIDVQNEAIRTFERGTTEPTIKPTGLLWHRTDEPVIGEAFKEWTGAAWRLLLDPEFPQLNAGGTVAAAADQPMGGFKFTGLAAGSAAGHSVRYEQVLLLAGGTMAGDIDMDGNAITNLPDPTNAQDAATKTYVDSAGPTRGSLTGVDLTSERTVTLGWEPKLVLVNISRTDATLTNAYQWTPVLIDDATAINTAIEHAATRMNYGSADVQDVITLTRTATGFKVKLSSTSGNSNTNIVVNYQAYPV